MRGNENLKAFTSPVEALCFVKDNIDSIQLILLDISMPKMDGFKFLEALSEKKLDRQAKVAMYTSSIQEADKQKALEYPDVVDFLVKPASESDLRRILEEK